MAKILIGITGSIAGFKTISLARNLTKAGHQVKIILTPAATSFITPSLFAGLKIHAYTDSLINYNSPVDAMLHIELARWADLFLIAPASANSIAKLAHGISDNLLTEVALAYNKAQAIYLAPAMNQAMWQNPLNQENLQKLTKYNFKTINPITGEQACGEIGPGRMIEINDLETKITNLLTTKSKLQGKTLLITLGGTIEPIDPVRYISNHSSGKMGLALINEALSLGMRVQALVAKITVDLPTHSNLIMHSTLNANNMLEKALSLMHEVDIVIGAAAVADYRVKTPALEKIKKGPEILTLELIKNPDILKTIRHSYPHKYLVGFALESKNEITLAQEKLKYKKLDLCIFNCTQSTQIFNQHNTQISLLDKTGCLFTSQLITKESAAHLIFKQINVAFEK